MFLSRFQGLVVCLLVCAAGFSECSDPQFDVLMEAQGAAGMAIERCGGARLDAPEELLDPACVEENQLAHTPYEAWTAAIGRDGAAIYVGEIGFYRDDVAHVWNLRDARELGDALTVRRCVRTAAGNMDCAPEVCLDGC